MKNFKQTIAFIILVISLVIIGCACGNENLRFSYVDPTFGPSLVPSLAPTPDYDEIKKSITVNNRNFWDGEASRIYKEVNEHYPKIPTLVVGHTPSVTVKPAPTNTPAPTPAPTEKPDYFIMIDTPNSTYFSEIGYNPTQRIIRVCFRDEGYYQFLDVKDFYWIYFQKAESVDDFYDTYIKNKYSYIKESDQNNVIEPESDAEPSNYIESDIVTVTENNIESDGTIEDNRTVDSNKIEPDNKKSEKLSDNNHTDEDNKKSVISLGKVVLLIFTSIVYLFLCILFLLFGKGIIDAACDREKGPSTVVFVIIASVIALGYATLAFIASINPVQINGIDVEPIHIYLFSFLYYISVNVFITIWCLLIIRAKELTEISKSIFIIVYISFLVVPHFCINAHYDNKYKEIVSENKTAIVQSIETPVPTTAPTHISEASPTATQIPTDGYKDDGKLHVYIVGEGEKVMTPESSFINYIVYFPESKHMIINMNGTDYTFANVSRSLWDEFKNAESKGTFYNDRIKGRSEYLLNEYISGRGDDVLVEYINYSITLIEPQKSIDTPLATPNYTYSYSEHDYECCEMCGKTYHVYDLYYSDHSEIYICEDCLEYSDYYFCDGCGELFHINYLYEDDYELYCWRCLDSFDF